MSEYFTGSGNMRDSFPSIIVVIAPDLLEGLEENLSFEGEHQRQVSWFPTKYTVSTENKFNPSQSCNQRCHCQPSSMLPSAAPTNDYQRDITSELNAVLIYNSESFSAPRTCIDQAEIKVAT